MSETKSSRVSISARSFAIASGAGSRIKATATSPTGETIISNAEQFVTDGTSSRGSGVVSASSDSSPSAIATTSTSSPHSTPSL